MNYITEETAKELNDKLDRLLKLLEPKQIDPNKKKTKAELRKEKVEEYSRQIKLKYLKKNLKNRGL